MTEMLTVREVAVRLQLAKTDAVLRLIRSGALPASNVSNCDALDVIRQQDGPDTLFYCDPPYVPSTRTAREVYAHEMTVEQHAGLLDTLAGIKGRFLLSGYDNPLYARAKARWGWRREPFDVANHAAGGKAKRRMTEVVWLNY